jgi:hypothetical protein
VWAPPSKPGYYYSSGVEGTQIKLLFYPISPDFVRHGFLQIPYLLENLRWISSHDVKTTAVKDDFNTESYVEPHVQKYFKNSPDPLSIVLLKTIQYQVRVSYQGTFHLYNNEKPQQEVQEQVLQKG